MHMHMQGAKSKERWRCSFAARCSVALAVGNLINVVAFTTPIRNLTCWSVAEKRKPQCARSPANARDMISWLCGVLCSDRLLLVPGPGFCLCWDPAHEVLGGYFACFYYVDCAPLATVLATVGSREWITGGSYFEGCAGHEGINTKTQ